MASAAPTAPASTRLSWLDGMKGISILWIAFFHFFSTYANGRYPSPLGPDYFSSFVSQCAPSSALGTLSCVGQGFFVAVSSVGFNAVEVFLVLSGFGLTYSLAKTGNPEGGWASWYRGRLLRLFPMYWVAHLICLVSPFVAQPDPLDYRLVLSLLGIRVYTVHTYINPAWWYFGLLLELYLLFPVLFRLLQRLGPLWFLVLCGVLTVASRYLFFGVLSAYSYYVQGAFLGLRLWEFTLGMVLGLLYRQRPSAVERALFTGSTFLAGIVIYTLGLYSYATTLSYSVTDPLIGTGLSVILAHLVRWSGTRLGAMLAHVGVYSYGLYLLHQPYVIYFGERMRDLSLPTFVILAGAIIVLLTLCAIPLERGVNQLLNQLIERRKESMQPSAASQKRQEAGG